jgi:hypothetical protein
MKRRLSPELSMGKTFRQSLGVGYGSARVADWNRVRETDGPTGSER